MFQRAVSARDVLLVLLVGIFPATAIAMASESEGTEASGEVEEPAVPADSGPLGVGAQLDPVSLGDQHGKQHALDASVRAILFSRDRAGAGLMTASMETRDAAFLGPRGVVYVNDISPMPKAAATLFALPKMRRRSYAILLDRTGEVTKDFPDKDRFATLIHLEALKISKIEYLGDAESLAKRLEELPKGK